MANKAWYALRVQSEREEKIKEGLMARIRAKGLEQHVLQIVVPAENVQDMREGKKRTEAIFGEFIDKYTIRQAEADGAVVPILYEGRTAKGAVAGGSDLDELFEDMFAGKIGGVGFRYFLQSISPKIRQVAVFSIGAQMIGDAAEILD